MITLCKSFRFKVSSFKFVVSSYLVTSSLCYFFTLFGPLFWPFHSITMQKYHYF